ncbi:MAG: UDP-N-acetylglucosamine 1-carboxyvinyltransferase [bacterium]|nr:UDP-N-acetylglucosamine 1-carboxyvinyltransferase [bacterium]
MTQDQQFIIRGGRILSGTVRVGGAKNAALKVIAASLLSKEPWRIERLPLVEDVLRVVELVRSLGVAVSGPQVDGTVILHAEGEVVSDLDTEIAKRIRASIVLTGPILARQGRVSFPHPGGCVIGERPIDVFLKGYRAMGAEVAEENDRYVVTALGGLRGADIFFPVVSVTGTETLMMAATLAKGTTVLRNAAMEPEVASLADFLNACGARISGHGTPTIRIEGVDALGGGTYRTMPDRIETGSFALMAAATRSKIAIEACEPSHLDALWDLLQYAGVLVEKREQSVLIDATGSAPLAPKNITTHEYPGFATDLQAPAVVFLTQCSGAARVHETIFEGRLQWTGDLVRMGASIEMADPHRVFVHGPASLRGRSIKSPDIRAGMAFVIAALVAEGETTIHNIYQIDRGYEKLEERLRRIGADIRRVTGNQEPVISTSSVADDASYALSGRTGKF